MEKDKEQDSQAKACLVSCMQEGQSWQRASTSAGLQISQSNAYRLWRAFRQRGETALEDGRHGHPIKLRGEARSYLEDACRKAPQTPSSTVQTVLREHFNVSVSISQINRVRAALGVSNRPQNQEQGKKRKEKRSLHHRQNGKKVLAVFCYSPPPIKRASLRSFKQPSRQASSPLLQRCVLHTSNLRRCAASC
jgi:transposase